MKLLTSILFVYVLASCASHYNKPQLSIRNSSMADPYKEQIRNVIRANKLSIKKCYEEGLKQNKNLYGKIILKWHYIKGGIVTKTEVISNTLGDDIVAPCISKEIKTFIFPEPGDDKEAIVTFPFVFSPN